MTTPCEYYNAFRSLASSTTEWVLAWCFAFVFTGLIVFIAWYVGPCQHLACIGEP